MADNRGKQWAAKFRQDFINSFPEGEVSIDRLYDTTNGFASISNISDFIGYHWPLIYYLECKSHKGSSFPFSALSQYEKLKAKVGIKGVRAGVALWLIDKHGLYYLPISTVTKILDSGVKSFNPDKLNEKEYPYYIIPGKEKRVFIEGDWSILAETKEGE